MGFEISNGSIGIFGAIFIALGVGAGILVLVFMLGAAKLARDDVRDDPDNDLDA